MASFEMYSSTWQLEVSLAGAGFSISGQFINRADNWENRVVGVQHSRAGSTLLIRCSLAHCLGEQPCSEGQLAYKQRSANLGHPPVLLVIFNRPVQISFLLLSFFNQQYILVNSCINQSLLSAFCKVRNPRTVLLRLAFKCYLEFCYFLHKQLGSPYVCTSYVFGAN